MARDPGAAQPAPKKSNTIWWILVCGGFFVVVSLCVSPFIFCGGLTLWRANEEDKLEKAVESEPGTPVTAEELTEAYNDDSRTADSNSKYKNKVLVVSGKVVTVNPDKLSLEGTWPGGGRLKTSVHCYVAKKNQGQLATVQPEDHVKVKGYFSAEILPIIKLEHCQIEK
jgi:hypothetical protein